MGRNNEGWKKVKKLTALTKDASITSLEISELVNRRHDNVKRVIESFIEQRVIACPQIEDVQISGGNNRVYTTQVYRFISEQGKRDSIIVVAQLSPEFTARLVDRWQELESRVANPDPVALLNDPEALRGLLFNYTEKVISLEHVVKEQAPKVAFHDQVVAAPDAITMSEAAKLLGTGRNRLMSRLRQQRWLTRQNEPYQEKIEAGLMDVKLSQLWDHPEKGLKRSVTPLLTGKGLVRLRESVSRH